MHHLLVHSLVLADGGVNFWFHWRNIDLSPFTFLRFWTTRCSITPFVYFSCPPVLLPPDAACIAMNLSGSCSNILPIAFVILMTIDASSFMYFSVISMSVSTLSLISDSLPSANAKFW